MRVGISERLSAGLTEPVELVGASQETSIGAELGEGQEDAKCSFLSDASLRTATSAEDLH